MLRPKLIVAPIDFSDPALEAVDSAADMASLFGAVLLLVHVVPALPRLPTNVSMFKEEEYERWLHEEAVRKIIDLSKTYEQTGVSVRTEVGTANDVGMEILRVAKNHKADLIVIATHGMSGWHKLLFGSVAEKVLRLSDGPVLLLKAAAEKQAGI
jgi:nucleotide-binding universal stress UspA family protein